MSEGFVCVFKILNSEKNESKKERKSKNWGIWNFPASMKTPKES